jgi:hemin uptake protein HemP
MFERPLRNVSVSDQTLQAELGADTRNKRIDSSRLLAGSREVVIEHAGQEYRLRLTRNDKLILTK